VGGAATLTLEDALSLYDPSSAPAVLMVAPEAQMGAQVVAGRQNTWTRILGVTPEYQFVRNFPVAEGEFIGERHLQARSMVAVLGASVVEALFPETSPLGQSIKINRRPFRVIGVLEQKGGTGLGIQDDVVMVPITTLLERLQAWRTIRGGRRVQLISVQAVSDREVEAAKEQVASILRERHRITSEDDFIITTQQETIEALEQTIGVFVIFLGAIAGISLLVGGIGIMNIMLVSVTERTREIGIRKAVGARRKDILLQFLTEATLLSLAGGGVGVLSGWGVSRLISGIQVSGQVIRTAVSADIVLLAVMVSAAVGLFFGIYPAFRAARLNPIEALRYE
jgi:putative ABC transport system permease protein